MTWNHFPYFALVAVLLWAVGAYAAWKDKKALTLGATVAGLLVFFGFIVAMWVSLERNAPVVFVLPSFCWNGRLLALALQVDTLFQYNLGHRFYCYQRDETRDTQQNADASLAKSMVRPPTLLSTCSLTPCLARPR